MGHNDTNKKNSTEHIGDEFINYQLSWQPYEDNIGFRPPPIPGGLFPPSPPSFPPYKPNNYENNSPYGPPGSPPNYSPSKNDKGVQSLSSPGGSAKSVSPNSISICLYKFTYIWERNGRSYWTYLLNVDRTSVSGFRWLGRNWVLFGLDLRRIDSFVCYRNDSFTNNIQDSTRAHEDILPSFKKEFTTLGQREIYCKDLLSVEIPEVKEDFLIRNIGIIDDKNIDSTIPCIKSRDVVYRIVLEISLPEDLTTENKSKIVQATEAAIIEAKEELTKNNRSNTLNLLENFNASINNIPSALNIFDKKFKSQLNDMSSSIKSSVNFRMVYDKTPTKWFTHTNY